MYRLSSKDLYRLSAIAGSEETLKNWEIKEENDKLTAKIVAKVKGLRCIESFVFIISSKLFATNLNIFCLAVELPHLLDRNMSEEPIVPAIAIVTPSWTGHTFHQKEACPVILEYGSKIVHNVFWKIQSNFSKVQKKLTNCNLKLLIYPSF